MRFLAVCLAGGAGAVARLWLNGWVRGRRHGPFPLGTVTINVTGSFVLGILTGLVLFQGASATVGLVAGTGFCGGYTTFSTASFETVRLVEQRQLRAAVASAAGTLVLAVAGAAAGMAIGSL